MKRVVIIGAGLGGIATASYLRKAGYDVSVYEQLNYLGGKAGVLQENGFTFDIGPSWYLMPEVFEHYFRLFDKDVQAELGLVQLDPFYKVFFEHSEPVVIGPDQAHNRHVFESIEPGAATRLDRYVQQSCLVYDMALKHFLYTNFQNPADFLHPEIFRHTPTLLKLATQSYDGEVSRHVRDRRLRQILEYSAVFLGASPFDASAIYTLMAALDYRDGVWYPKGGIYTVVERMVDLARQLGVRFHTNSPAVRIVTEQGRATGVELASGEIVEADIVISNADLHHTETKLLPRQLQTYPESYWQRRNSGPSSLMLYLGVRGQLPELEHHDLLFVDDWRGNFEAIYTDKRLPEKPSIYISRTTATDPQFAPQGHEALVVLVPLPSGLELSDETYRSYGDQIIAQIEVMTGIGDLAGRIVYRQDMTPNDFGSRYNAWELGSIGPAHTLKQTAIFRTGNSSKKVSNLYYVGGATIPGVGMPMVLISAELIYKKIVGIRQGGAISQIESVD